MGKNVDLKTANEQEFTIMCDDLVMYASEGEDLDLQAGIRWVDEQASKNGLSFYEMALVVLRKHIAETRARDWVKTKSG